MDVWLWSLVWALIAVVAGLGLAAAARALVRRTEDAYEVLWFRGYNALAPQVDR